MQHNMISGGDGNSQKVTLCFSVVSKKKDMKFDKEWTRMDFDQDKL